MGAVMEKCCLCVLGSILLSQLVLQGVDAEALSAKKKRNADKKPYIPTFVTAERENETKGSQSEEEGIESEIWELSERSNKNNPKQELGSIEEGVTTVEIEGCPHAHLAHADNAKIEL